jgi:CRISPR/Cas system-associated exonuclease Cas4 (RecB family)
VDHYYNKWETEIKESEINWEDDKKEEIMKSAVPTLTNYHTHICPGLVPKKGYVEKMIEVPFQNVDYQLKVRVDLYTDKGMLLDYKVALRSMPENAFWADPQMASYVVAIKTDTGKLPKDIRVDQLLLTKSPKVAPIFIKIEDLLIDNLFVLIQRIEFAMRTGAFYPTHNPVACSWCGYKDLCSSGKWG